MGTCCSKRRDRQSRGPHIVDVHHHHHSTVLHPMSSDLLYWKQRSTLSRHSCNLSEQLADFVPAPLVAYIPGNHVPAILGTKPPANPSAGFPSLHYTLTGLLCDSNRMSSRSLGNHVIIKPHDLQLQVPVVDDDYNSIIPGDKLRSGFSDLLSISSCHASLMDPDADIPPPFSFSTQPYVEADFSNSTTFEFHAAARTHSTLSYPNIDSGHGIKLKVRHKHMFPQDLEENTACSCEEPTMRRSRSHGTLLAVDPEEQQSIQQHRKSFQETLVTYKDFSMEVNMSECVKHDHGEFSLINSQMTGTKKERNEIDDDEEDDGFHDITEEICIAQSETSLGHVKEDEDIKFCTSMEVSATQNKVPSMDYWNDDRTKKCCPTESLDIFEFKHAPSQKNILFLPGKQKEWQDVKYDEYMKAADLLVVSTGDAILFSSANSDELHLIPSRCVHKQASILTSPKVATKSGGYFSFESEERAGPGALTVEDIILLLENDELDEDEILSLLIDPKSSTSLSTSSSLLSLSLSSTLSSGSASSMASKSLPLSPSSSLYPSPSSAMPWFTSASNSGPLSFSVPQVLPVSLKPSTPTSSLFSHRPLLCRRMSSNSSFEFKVKSCSSSASTPIFASITSSTSGKRNIAHLKATALTTEEIAEIWGVFEQRQALVSPFG